MKKKFVYRKLELDNKVYYQMYKIINENEVEENEDNLYRDVNYDDESILNDFLYTIYEEKKGKLDFIKNSVLITKLHQMFYDKYHDFNLLMKHNFDVDKINELIHQEIMFQETPIKELLNVIKSNLDIASSSIDDNKKRRLISNIILHGPKGFGKSTTVNNILKNSGVPSVSIKLTTDSKENITSLIQSLATVAMGNMKYAENSIVFIEDNFDELMDELDEADEFETNPFIYLEDLLRNEYVALGDNQELVVDLSKITYVLVKNTASKEVITLYDEGITESLIYQFKTIISFNRLSKNEMKEVFLNSENSILKTYEELLRSMGKKLIIEDDFLDLLIDRLYYAVGGIGLINDVIELMIKTRWNNDVICLNKKVVLEETEDLNFLQVNANEEDDSLSDSEVESYKKKVQNKKDDNAEHQKDFSLDLSTAKEEYKNMLTSIMKYVKGQDEPLKNLLFHAFINDKVQNSNLDPDMKKERISHMLIRGGAGTGKSFITSLIAKHLDNKPYAVIDCKRYTEAGYVGKSIDDMLVQLYYAAECDIERAQNGILILDEIDKLSRNNDTSSVSRGGVQESLLKLMEGTVFDLEIKENGFTKTINFDTRSLMIICAGAFEGLDKIKEKRLKLEHKPKTMGFQRIEEEKKVFVDPHYTLEDMQEFGMDAQLLRRINFHCDLNKLTKDDYKNIMLNSKSSAFLIKLERLNMLGVEVVYNDEFIDTFAEKVSTLGFGVSGIAILIERIFSNFESKIMLENYTKVILNKECIEDPNKIILEKSGKVYKKRKQ